MAAALATPVEEIAYLSEGAHVSNPFLVYDRAGRRTILHQDGVEIHTMEHLLAAVAGEQSTTVMRLKASGGPGASVIGLQGDFTQQSESESRGVVVCRSGSTDGAIQLGSTCE